MQNTSDWLDLAPGGGFNAFIAVGDSVRRARISLLFAENGLVAVGVRGYEGWAAAQRQAFE